MGTLNLGFLDIPRFSLKPAPHGKQQILAWQMALPHCSLAPDRRVQMIEMPLHFEVRCYRSLMLVDIWGMTDNAVWP
ncbi:hypothetical protein WT83_05670 [Burkholderia territorii]|uniref:Uncharacterized protein n=1 Tax=Burkholderia territorii TaxID=1503055 RepID=A0A108F1W1_9BURK|nr:hypothetical protein WT83_05670 [Burkholderia territorii]